MKIWEKVSCSGVALYTWYFSYQFTYLSLYLPSYLNSLRTTLDFTRSSSIPWFSVLQSNQFSEIFERSFYTWNIFWFVCHSHKFALAPTVLEPWVKTSRGKNGVNISMILTSRDNVLIQACTEQMGQVLCTSLELLPFCRERETRILRHFLSVFCEMISAVALVNDGKYL